MRPVAVQATSAAPTSDARLVRAARAGDVRAFDAIVADKLADAFRLAAAILGNGAEAADAAQNALVAAWRELPRLRDCGAFDAWFERILVTECRMRSRHRGRRAEVPPDREVGEGDPTAAVSLVRLELLDELEAAFERLDPEDQAMVVMHHLEGRPLTEIAASLHMPAGTVKWRLHEARAAFQQALDVTR
jgi:RNA polymerase sigma-70 factor (ECF subfamily)